MSFRFLEFQPPPGLELILRGSFFARGRIGYRSDKILPTGLIPVLFNMGRPHRVGKSPRPDENASFAHSWIDGFQTTPTYNTPTDGTHVLGLLFEPVGFHALFDADMPAVRDQTVDGRELLPPAFIKMMEASPQPPRCDSRTIESSRFSRRCLASRFRRGCGQSPKRSKNAGVWSSWHSAMSGMV